MIEWVKSLTAHAETTTLEDVQSAIEAAHDARAALVTACEDAKQTIKAHNAEAQQTIAALSASINAVQQRVEIANRHLADVTADQEKAA